MRIVGIFLGIVGIAIASEANKDALTKHVYTLAHDSMEGRLAGTAGELRAISYITTTWQQQGYTIVGKQPVTIIKERKASPGSTVKIDHRTTHTWKLTRWSGADTLTGIIEWLACTEEMDSTYPLSGKVPIITECPHLPHGITMGERLSTLRRRGALAFILSREVLTQQDTITRYNLQWMDVPVLALPEADSTLEGKPVSISLDITVEKDTAWNLWVVDSCQLVKECSGRWVVLSAHFDHLGRGEIASRNNYGEIHNGADDNASGVALLLELGQWLKKYQRNRHHYLLVAFTAEEMGLIGSKQFVENPPIPLSTVLANINFDMVGRLDSQLQLLATASSPLWDTLIERVTSKHKWNFSIKSGGNGLGPSDHAEFYKKGIPVMHVFTGLHTDYHKPSDDASKINYNGMAEIFNFITALLTSLDKVDSLPYQQTSTSDKQPARLRVTLGIMPDYTFSHGVKVDAVVEGKPAHRAGIKAGDIITALGKYTITDIYSYMEALSHFAPGDTTTITIQRADTTLTLPLTFPR